MEAKQSRARAAAGVAGGGAVVLALVEEDAGLLAAQEVGGEIEAVHPDGDGLGDLAGEDGGFERQLLLGADRDVVAGDDALGLEDLFEAGDDVGLGGVHALVEGLDDEVVAIAIHDQGGQEVGFAVDDAVGVGVVDDGAAVLLGGAEALQIEIAADLFDLPREHADGDLGGGAVVRRAEGAAALVGDLDGLAGLGAVAVHDVAGEDPRVAGGDPVGRLPVYPDFVHRIACRRAMRSSVEGWVEKRRMIDWPVNGLMMNM